LIVVAQLEPFAGIGEPTKKRAISIGVTRRRRQSRRRNGDNEVTATRNDCAFRELELDAPVQRPAGEVHVHRHLAVQFEPFERRLVRRGVIHDFVEYHCAVGPRGAGEEEN